MKISKQELIDMIRTEAKSIKSAMIQESDAVSDSVNVYDVDMNSNDELGDSDKALTYKDPSKKIEKEGENEKMPKMNSKDNVEGSDKKSAVAVKVDAGAKKGGDTHTKGQAKANFTSKKEIQGTDASGPFDERVEDLEMNSEDKLVDEKAKTYVSAGYEKKGNSHISPSVPPAAPSMPPSGSVWLLFAPPSPSATEHSFLILLISNSAHF